MPGTFPWGHQVTTDLTELVIQLSLISLGVYLRQTKIVLFFVNSSFSKQNLLLIIELLPMTSGPPFTKYKKIVSCSRVGP